MIIYVASAAYVATVPSVAYAFYILFLFRLLSNSTSSAQSFRSDVTW